MTHTPYGPIGRLGRWTATHFAAVATLWALLAVALGFFAPRVETALSGAGWEATGSESVRARQQIDRDFAGLGTYALTVAVHSRRSTVSDPAFVRALRGVEAKLKGRQVVSVSRDRHTAVVQIGAGRDANDMV